MRAALALCTGAFLGVFLGALLGACAPPPSAPPAEVSLLRNPTAAIGSQADVAAIDLAGQWVVRQAVASRWPASAAELTIGVAGGGLSLTDPAGGAVDYLPDLQGRWVAADRAEAAAAGLPSQIWVHWMDFDDRTVALGNPDGHFVAILDRSATGGADRITAARDILSWYGYDLSKLVRIAR